MHKPCLYYKMPTDDNPVQIPFPARSGLYMHSQSHPDHDDHCVYSSPAVWSSVKLNASRSSAPNLAYSNSSRNIYHPTISTPLVLAK